MSEVSPILAIATNIRKVVNDSLCTRDPATQSAVIVTELSSAIAYSLQLPANPLDSRNEAERYYTQYHLPVVRKVIGEINELFIIDIITIQRVVHTLWTLRYRLVHEPLGAGELVTNLARISQLLPTNLIEKTLPFYNVGEESNAEIHAVKRLGDNLAFNINKVISEGIK